MQKEKLNYLNLYKIVAAVIIACFLHYDQLFLSFVNLEFKGNNVIVRFLMASTSNWLVEFFFVMSGLLFVYAYLEQIENGKMNFSVFIWNRVIKLIPLVIITTIVMFVLQIFCLKTFGKAFFPGDISLDAFISAIFLMGSNVLRIRVNAPTWYIANLFICYIIAYFLTKYRQKVGMLTYLIPIVVGVIIREKGLTVVFFDYTSSRAYIAFFIGVLVGLILPHLNKNKTLFFGGVGIALPLILRNYVYDWGMVSTVMLFPGLLLIGYNSKVLNKLCDNRIIKCLGKLSFDLYLWNFPILVVFAFLSRWVEVNTYWFVVLLVASHLIVGLISNIIMKRAVKPINLYCRKIAEALCSVHEEVNE